MNRSIVVAYLAWMSACGGDDGGGADATADGDGSGSTGGSGPSTSATSPETTAMSQTASAETTADTSATTPGTESTTVTTDTTMGTTSNDSSTASESDASASESSSSGAMPTMHNLSNSDQEECGDPLWCFYNGNVDVPAGDPIEGQECFVSPIEPPFELTEMHYIVATTHTDLEAFQLRIYARDGGAPMRLIEAIDVTSVEAAPIEHYYDFDPPIVIDSQEFCVGFGAFEPGLASSIGMAVDTASAVPDVSYVRMEGSGECDIPDWEDATMHVPAPAGNWCIDATIVSIP